METTDRYNRWAGIPAAAAPSLDDDEPQGMHQDEQNVGHRDGGYIQHREERLQWNFLGTRMRMIACQDVKGRHG